MEVLGNIRLLKILVAILCWTLAHSFTSISHSRILHVSSARKGKKFAAASLEETSTCDEKQANKEEANESDLFEVDNSGRLTPRQERKAAHASVEDSDKKLKKKKRLSLPSRIKNIFGRKNDELDKQIINMAVPNMINLGVVPIVNAVDTFWVGRLGVALALAGQAAANQACFTLFFLISFLPSIVAPIVASAVASGDTDEAQQKVCESVWLCMVFGLAGTVALAAFPRPLLKLMVLPEGSAAMDYAAPYLRWRALGMVPSLISATGFAAYRGMLNTVTPLKVSLATNAVNLFLDPLCIFSGGMGFVGAAVATAVSEIASGLVYWKLLLQRKLLRWSKLLKPPSWKSVWPLLKGGGVMLIRQLALNVGFLVATRRAQELDPTGVSGAAYGITMQLYSVGIIICVAMQNTAATLVPSTLAATKNNKDKARTMANRLLNWSTLVGSMVALLNFVSLPFLVPMFSTVPEVREAAKIPSLIASGIHLLNGPILAGEGILMGLGCYRDLTVITTAWIATMMACFSAFRGLNGIMWSILLSSIVQLVGLFGHFKRVGPLAVSKEDSQK